VKLPAQARESVEVCLRLLDGYTEEIQKQNLQLSEKAKQDERVEWLMTIPGIGECSAMMVLAEIGDIGTLSRQGGVVQLCGAGAAGAGVGGQSGAGRDHAARFAVAALDDGGSGAGGDAQFAGGQRYYERLLRKKHKHVARVALEACPHRHKIPVDRYACFHRRMTVMALCKVQASLRERCSR
jgi:hypothetical protein